MFSKSAQSVPAFAQAHHRHVIIVASLACIIAGLLAGYVVVSQMLAEEGSALAELQTRKEKEEVQVKYLKSLKDSLRATELERARLGTYFMNERSVAAFLGRVEQMGRGIGLETETVSLGVEKGVLKTNVRVQGSFGAVQHFMALFEKLPYKLRIDAADIRSGSQGVWSGDFRVSVVSFTPVVSEN